MKKRGVSRRQLLSSFGLAAGASVLAGYGELSQGESPQENSAPSGAANALQPAPQKDDRWKYVRLDPAPIAAEAYRLMLQGGCMYGLFGSVMNAMAKLQGEPYRSFPVQMMKYGAGGVGHYGSLCGAANGGAAVIGLCVPDKELREQLIAELFAWYETTELPKYLPRDAGNASSVLGSVARSVLCHVSAGKWCRKTGNAVDSPQRKERCRRLTADVAAKTIELLNATLRGPCKASEPSAEVKSCMSCHGKELRDTVSKMQCTSCHTQLSTKHPTVSIVPRKPQGALGNGKL